MRVTRNFSLIILDISSLITGIDPMRDGNLNIKINRLSFPEVTSRPITSRNDVYNFSVYQRIIVRLFQPGWTGQSSQSTSPASQSSLTVTQNSSNCIS